MKAINFLLLGAVIAHKIHNHGYDDDPEDYDTMVATMKISGEGIEDLEQDNSKGIYSDQMAGVA